MRYLEVERWYGVHTSPILPIQIYFTLCQVTAACASCYTEVSDGRRYNYLCLQSRARTRQNPRCREGPEIIADKSPQSRFVLRLHLKYRVTRGRQFWLVAAEREGRRFIVHADEKLTAFLELERAVCIHLLSEQC